MAGRGPTDLEDAIATAPTPILTAEESSERVASDVTGVRSDDAKVMNAARDVAAVLRQTQVGRVSPLALLEPSSAMLLVETDATTPLSDQLFSALSKRYGRCERQTCPASRGGRTVVVHPCDDDGAILDVHIHFIDLAKFVPFLIATMGSDLLVAKFNEMLRRGGLRVEDYGIYRETGGDIEVINRDKVLPFLKWTENWPLARSGVVRIM